MADNPLMREALRAAANRGRIAAESVGVRPVLVSVRVRVYNGPVGASGTTLVSTTDTALNPRPKVRMVSEGRGGYFGGGLYTDSTGRVLAGEYEVGPITQDFPGGGYTPAELLPTGSVSRRVTLVLAGDGFQSGGEEFEAVKMDASRPFRTMLLVVRVRQGV